MMRVNAPAKLNLFLHIGDRRDDGFHDLESLAVFVEQADVLNIAPADDLSLKIGGPFAGALEKEPDNLVLRSARALDASRGAAMTLEKNLPIGAGIGGGSADAGAALRGLNMFWGLERDPAELSEIAARLGSDVPACLLSQPLWMEGRGEVVQPIAPIPLFELVLVNPNTVLSTAAVYANLNVRTGIGTMSPPNDEIGSIWDLVTYLADSGNDLEMPACAMTPTIDEVLAALAHEPGCVLAQMSGSGPTCFGIFQEGPWAQGAAKRIAEDQPQWWVSSTRIATRDFAIPKPS